MEFKPLSFLLITSLVLATSCRAGDGPSRFAVALSPTPVLNTPDFAAVFGGRDGKTLHTDKCGQIRAMEFVALPETAFRIEAAIPAGDHAIYRVSTADYPYPSASGYFVDSRFVKETASEPPPRPRRLPPRETIIARLRSATGTRYVWGGNVRRGVAEILCLYPPPAGLDPATLERWQLAGLDCSGLLYEATDGWTPRNTSALVDSGRGVPIAGLGAADIVRRARPLDLIVWQGHVLIVIDRNQVIESHLDCGEKGDGGVRVRPLAGVIGDLLATRVPLDTYGEAGAHGRKGFVIRRLFPEESGTR